MFKALRTIPVIFSIIEDAKELCPDAWIINFTNPAGLVTEAVLRYAEWDKFIGVCNLPYGMEVATAKMLDVEKSRLRIDFAGLNHMVFGLDFYVDGKSVKKKLFHDLLDQAGSVTMKNIANLPWSPEFLRGLDAMPCAYHRYYFQKEEMLKHVLEDFAHGKTRGTIVKEVEEQLFRQYADPTLDIKPEELSQRGGAFYSDAACNLISSMYNDKRDIQTVNTRNRGAIASLPNDVAVEVSCVITKEGPRPLTMGRLPIAAEGIVQQIKAFELLVAKAAISGDYNDALVAMITNPLVQSEVLGRKVLDELLIAHKRHLPQFKAVIQKLEG